MQHSQKSWKLKSYNNFLNDIFDFMKKYSDIHFKTARIRAPCTISIGSTLIWRNGFDMLEYFINNITIFWFILSLKIDQNSNETNQLNEKSDTPDHIVVNFIENICHIKFSSSNSALDFHSYQNKRFRNLFKSIPFVLWILPFTKLFFDILCVTK